MVDDAIPEDQLLEDEEVEADSEVNKVLQEVLQGRLSKTEAPKTEAKPQDEERVEEDFEDQEATLEQMRGRLEALKS